MNNENKIQRLQLMPVDLSRLEQLIPLDEEGGLRPLLRDAIYYSYKIGRIESPGLIYVPGVGNVSVN